jgi:hypothetical protein
LCFYILIIIYFCVCVFAFYHHLVLHLCSSIFIIIAFGLFCLWFYIHITFVICVCVFAFSSPSTIKFESTNVCVCVWLNI